ncbi:MAG: hypothetical protein RLZZ303_2840 [Candidatus Hydrogenedentota bacterium]|jgi:TRAP-type C4-dicarboxylate transport system permease small subunit
MNPFSKLESAGWGFFGVSCLFFAAPGVWLAWSITYDSATPATRIAFGIFMACIVAAFFTAAVNELLHRRNLRRAEKKRNEPGAKPAQSRKRGK